MVAVAEAPVDGAELLRGVDRWLAKLANAAARRHGWDVDDLLQDFRVRAFLMAPKYDPGRGKPTTWAGAVALSVVRDRRGRRRKRPILASQSERAALALGAAADCTPAPEVDAEAADTAAAVRGMLVDLGGPRGKALALWFGIGEPQGLTGREIGEQLGVSRGGAYALLRDGLEAVRGRAERIAG
jgi:RNA polymerase sigma factor (sigma-70 family)